MRVCFFFLRPFFSADLSGFETYEEEEEEAADENDDVGSAFFSDASCLDPDADKYE